jgi:hypothetical protein
MLHFIYFIVPNYFETNGSNLPLPHDFTSAFDAISEIVNAKYINGIFYYADVYWSHTEILNVMSYPFVYFGKYILNIAPLNSFMSIITAMNIYLISKYVFHFNSKQLRFITIIAAYFPLTLISSLFVRDMTGLALMSIGMTLVMYSPKGMIQYLMLVIASYLFYMHRTIYPIVLIVAFFINYYINSKDGVSARKRVFQFVIVLPVVVILLVKSISLGLSANEGYVESGTSINFLFLPVKLVMGIIGPFPWTQYFTTGRVEYSYQFSDYLQGALNVCVFFILFLFRGLYFKKQQFNLLNLTGLLLILVGLSTSFMHSSYVSIGVVFLLPWIANSNYRLKMREYFLVSFVSLLILSLFIFLFAGSLGLGSLWK